MKPVEIEERGPLLERLTELWERSVRATHSFLSEREIGAIRRYVPEALASVSRLIVAEDARGLPAAFMGIEEGRLEMLFVDPERRGQGLGRALLGLGISRYGVEMLAVNEQNPLACGFYRHMGFETYKRTERDEQGNPYPLLYMRRKKGAGGS